MFLWYKISVKFVDKNDKLALQTFYGPLSLKVNINITSTNAVTASMITCTILENLYIVVT